MKNNKFSSKLIMVALIGLSTVTSSYAERTFTSINENKLEGELIKFSKNIVSIETKSNGKVVNIPIEMLSMDDIEYVKNNFDPATGKIKFDRKINYNYLKSKIPAITPLEPLKPDGMVPQVFRYDKSVKTEFSIVYERSYDGQSTPIQSWNKFKDYVNENINGLARATLPRDRPQSQVGGKWTYPKSSEWQFTYERISKREYLKNEITKFIKFVDDHFVFSDTVKY